MDEDKLLRELAKDDLYSYAIGLHQGFDENRFSEAVATEIQYVMDGHHDRTIIVAPPRHGKSFITSETAPAWFLGKYPNKKIILASHTQDLADAFGGKVRDNMNSDYHRSVFGKFGSLKKGNRAGMSYFQTHSGGEFYTTGVGGSPIGKGADVYIIDDPIRNRADIESEKQRADLKDWYSSAVLTRLEGQGGIILMHQRWHDDDLVGWLLKEYPDENWRVIYMPALIETEEDEEVDYLGREIGEALCPTRYPAEKLLRLKNSLLERDWNSMYQGRPRTAGGDKFTEEMLLDYEESPEVIRDSLNVYIVVDPAGSSKKNADYTSMVVIGLGADGNYYILDLVREQLDLSGRTDKLMDLHAKWRPLSTGYERYGMQSDIQHINYVQAQVNYRFPIIELGGNRRLRKRDSIERLIPDMHNSRWYAPKWLQRVRDDGTVYSPVRELIDEEMIPFPAGKNDDTLDAVARIYEMPVMWPSAASFRTRSSNANKTKKASPW